MLQKIYVVNLVNLPVIGSSMQCPYFVVVVLMIAPPPPYFNLIEVTRKSFRVCCCFSNLGPSVTVLLRLNLLCLVSILPMLN